MKLFVFDTETTGLDETRHGLIQIAGYAINGDSVVGSINIFSDLFYRDEISQSALDVNGFTKEQIEGFQEPREAQNVLIEFLERHIDVGNPKDKLIPVGWNVSFDINFLKAWFKKRSQVYETWFDYHSVDVASLAIQPMLYRNDCDVVFPSQSAVAEKLGIGYLVGKKHTALGDAWVTGAILNRICRGEKWQM